MFGQLQVIRDGSDGGVFNSGASIRDDAGGGVGSIAITATTPDDFGGLQVVLNILEDVLDVGEELVALVDVAEG